VAVAVARGSTSGTLVAAVVGLALVAVCATMLARARAYRATLLARKQQLTASSKQTPGGPL
jgi:hypothetical protein